MKVAYKRTTSSPHMKNNLDCYHLHHLVVLQNWCKISISMSLTKSNTQSLYTFGYFITLFYTLSFVKKKIKIYAHVTSMIKILSMSLQSVLQD